jgi:hypothetical protein
VDAAVQHGKHGEPLPALHLSHARTLLVMLGGDAINGGY